MSDQWTLSIIEGPDEGRTFPIPSEGKFVIGRGADSDTKIRDPRLSRVHCELSFDDDELVLCDCGSAAGTFLDAVPIREPQTLWNGAQFQIGDSLMRVDSGNPDDDTSIPQGGVRSMSDLVGEVFFRYRLDELISAGRNSAVFRAFDTKRLRQVAIKLLNPQMTSTEQQRERFIRAMRTMLPVRHPNIVRLRKAGRAGPYCWAAMDWVEGISLDNLIELIGHDNTLDWKEVWHIGVDIGRALDEADRLRVVHRNVTPANIIRRQPDNAFLLSDLSFAKALDVTDAAQVTRPGDIVGELAYLAPERLLDASNLDTRSDIYGLGASLYAILTGQPPFVADDIASMLDLIRNMQPQKPSEMGIEIDPDFESILMRMIMKSPNNRFATPAALLSELERIGQFADAASDQVEDSTGAT